MNVTTKICVIISFLSINMQAIALPEITKSSNIVEQEKWRYVQQQFLLLTGNATGFINNIGSVLNTYGALPITSIVGGITIPIITALEIHDNLFRGLSVKERWGVSTALGASIIIIVYGLCKVIGHWLEAKNVVAERVLQQYLAQWNVHKSNTPEQLKELFALLSYDLIQYGQFTKINQQQAQKIVEAVLAMSVVATIA